MRRPPFRIRPAPGESRRTVRAPPRRRRRERVGELVCGAARRDRARRGGDPPDASDQVRTLILADFPLRGAWLAAAIDGLPAGTADLIRWHREHDDGTGFPDAPALGRDPGRRRGARDRERLPRGAGGGRRAGLAGRGGVRPDAARAVGGSGSRTSARSAGTSPPMPTTGPRRTSRRRLPSTTTRCWRGCAPGSTPAPPRPADARSGAPRSADRSPSGSGSTGGVPSGSPGSAC